MTKSFRRCRGLLLLACCWSVLAGVLPARASTNGELDDRARRAGAVFRELREAPTIANDPSVLQRRAAETVVDIGQITLGDLFYRLANLAN